MTSMNRDDLAATMADLVDHVLDDFEDRLRSDVLLVTLPPEGRRRPYGWTPGRPAATKAELTAELREAIKQLVAEACQVNEYCHKHGIPRRQ